MLPSPRRVITPCGSSRATRRLCAAPPLLESSGRVVDADQSTDTTLASSCRDLMSSFRYTLRRW